MNDGPVVILPHLGEFGWKIIRHVRYCNWHPSKDKIVCCAAGEECLYPSAKSHSTDWSNPIEDSRRWIDTAWDQQSLKDEFERELRKRLAALYPRHQIVRPVYDCDWHMSDGEGFKFRPAATAALPHVDVALGARRRDFASDKNWQHWGDLAAGLRSVGLSVGVVGGIGTSFDLPVDAKAWDHPERATAGSVDLLSHCRLYVGTDSGISHLSALCDSPSLIFRAAVDGNPDYTGLMERANKRFYRRLPDSAWDRPDEVLGATIRCLAELENSR